MANEPMVLDFDNAAHRKLFNGFVRGLRGPHRVRITKVMRQRSLAQNAYLWGVVYPAVAGGISEAWGESITVDEVHLAMKEKFLSEPVVDRKTGEVMMHKVGSTATLQVGEMCEYIDQIIKFAGEYLGIAIPEAS